MDRRLAPLVDAACVLALVVIGTRNHDSADSVGAVLSVGVPFWGALGLAWTLRGPWRDPWSNRTATTVWILTVAIGMVVRNSAFDRGTALPFVIVASLFLFATMFGWRALARRKVAQVAGGSENNGKN